MVSLVQSVRPDIPKMLSRSRWRIPTVEVLLDHDIVAGEMRDYLRARFESQSDGYYASVVKGAHGSGLLTSSVGAYALLMVPEGVTNVVAGERLEAQIIDRREEVAV